jgi:hypothetical protein
MCSIQAFGFSLLLFLIYADEQYLDAVAAGMERYREDSAEKG